MEEKSVDNKPGISSGVLILSVVIALIVGSAGTLLVQRIMSSTLPPVPLTSESVPPFPSCAPTEIGVIDDCTAMEGGTTFNLGDQFKLSLEKKTGITYSDPAYDKSIIELTKHVSSTTDGKEEWVFLTKSVGNTTFVVTSDTNGVPAKVADTMIQVDKRPADQPLLTPPAPVESK